MARTVVFGPVGIALPSGSGTGGNDKRIPLSPYKEAYLTSAYIVVPASQGPIWGTCQFRTASQIIGLGDAAWIRGDANFGGSDLWYFSGSFGLSSQGGNELVPLLRNDSAAAATPAVGGTLLIVRD